MVLAAVAHRGPILLTRGPGTGGPQPDGTRRAGSGDRPQRPRYGRSRDVRGSDSAGRIGDDRLHTDDLDPTARLSSSRWPSSRSVRARSSRPAGPARSRTGRTRGDRGRRPVDSAGPSRSTALEQASPALPALPAGWPSSHFELGLADAPGGAAALHAKAAVRLPLPVPRRRGQHGQRLGDLEHERPVRDVLRGRLGGEPASPRSSRTTCCSSRTRRPGDEIGQGPVQPGQPHHHGSVLQRSAAVLRPRRRLDPGRPPRRARPVGLHRAGQTGTGDDATTVPASVASSGDAALGDLPNTAAGFARAIVRLRDQLAPNVILAYHLSVWGTNWDISYSNNSNAEVDALAARAAAFYQSLGASFDVAFTDIADRDADFKKIVYGDGGAAWWDDADFVRYARFVAGFVAGVGQAGRRLADPARQHEDAGPGRHLGPLPGQPGRVVPRRSERDPPGDVARRRGGRAAVRRGSRRHDLRLRRQNDGVDEPAARSTATPGPRSMPTMTAATSTSGPPPTTRPVRSPSTEGSAVAAAVVAVAGHRVAWTLSAAPSPTSLTRRHDVRITARVRASRARGQDQGRRLRSGRRTSPSRRPTPPGRSGPARRSRSGRASTSRRRVASGTTRSRSGS